MITATCCGTAPCTRSWCSSSSSLIDSYFHDLRFLGHDQLVQLADMLVGQLLHVLFRAGFVVLGDALELPDLREGIGPRMADGDLPLLDQLVHDLDQLLAALLGEHGQ